MLRVDRLRVFSQAAEPYPFVLRCYAVASSMLNMNPSVFFVTGFAVCLTACQEKPQDEARVEAAAEARKVPEW